MICIRQGLSDISLLGCGELQNLSSLCRLYNLTRLTLRECDYLTDISALACCMHLESLALIDARELKDISCLAKCQRLDYVLLRETGVSSLQCMENHPSLRRIVIRDCPHIEKEVWNRILGHTLVQRRPSFESMTTIGNHDYHRY